MHMHTASTVTADTNISHISKGQTRVFFNGDAHTIFSPVRSTANEQFTIFTAMEKDGVRELGDNF